MTADRGWLTTFNLGRRSVVSRRLNHYEAYFASQIKKGVTTYVKEFLVAA